MKTTHLPVFLMWMISLAGAWAGDLPMNLWEPLDAKARAQAPVAELDAAIAEAIPAIIKYPGQNKGEAGKFAAAAGEPAVRDPVLNPEPEVAPFVPATPAPRPAGRKDNLQDLGDKLRARDLADLRDARQAWLTGLALGRVGLEFMLKHEPAIAQRQYDEAKRLLAENKSVTDTKVSLPELAAKTGDPARDRKEIAAFLAACRKAFDEKLDISLGMEGPFDPGGFFRLGLDAQQARLASAVDTAAERAASFRQLEKASRYCGLPAALWQPALASAQGGLSQMERDAVLMQFIKDVSARLDAEEKRVAAKPRSASANMPRPVPETPQAPGQPDTKAPPGPGIQVIAKKYGTVKTIKRGTPYQSDGRALIPKDATVFPIRINDEVDAEFFQEKSGAWKIYIRKTMMLL